MHDTVKPDYRKPECTVSELLTGQIIAQSGTIEGFDNLDDYPLS